MQTPAIPLEQRPLCDFDKMEEWFSLELALYQRKEDVGLAYVIEKYDIRGVLVMII